MDLTGPGEGELSGRMLPPLPLHFIQGDELARPSRLYGGGAPVPLDSVLDGTVAGVITSACRLPGDRYGDLVERPVGVGDRRDVLLHAERPLGRLEPGTEVRSPDLRTTALLRTYHPGLEAVPAGSGEVLGDPSATGTRPRVQPLWPDPGVESDGELLEPESWLPAPGQGIGVLVCAPRSAHHFGGVGVDPATDAVLQAERAVGDAFPFAVPLVRAQLFGDWLSIHGVVLAASGDRMVRARVRGHREDPVGVGSRLAEVLMARGAALLGPRERTEGPSSAPAL